MFLAVAASVAAPAAVNAARVEPLVGRTVADALMVLTAEGLPIVFSSAVVDPAWTVEREPEGRTPRERLETLLRPHGLTVAEGFRGRLVVVRRPAPRGEGRSGDDPGSEGLPTTRDAIEVAASGRVSAHGEPVGAYQLALGDSAREAPRFGEDPFRGVGLLPAAATRETSSQPSVRGGRREDVMVVLDGMELVAPYHLQEFDAALGIVPPASLSRVELIADPPPVEYGDRLGGVLDMRSRVPVRKRMVDLGVGSLFLEGAAAGTYGGDRGGWQGSARTGNYRLALEANGRHEDPRYWDVFGRLDHRLHGSQSLQLRVLLAQDEFDLTGDAIGGGRYESRWDNAYLWLTHLASLGPRVWVESVAWAARLERSRSGEEAALGGLRFDLHDARTLDLTGARTLWWVALPDDRWQIEGGAEIRQIDSTIDYRATRETGDALLAPPSGSVLYATDFDFDQAGVFGSVRWHARPNWTVEGGLRYDRTQLTREEYLSPRLHLAWSPHGGLGLFRAAWGEYHQSQRPYELQVEDGETEISPVERSEQSALSYERRSGANTVWRVGLFRRRTADPRPRYETLFDSAVLYPELAPGRVRLEASESRADGLELSMRGAVGSRFDYSVAYTLSSVEDRVDGRWVPRATDQRHALRLEGGFSLTADWRVTGVWQVHSGWPTTAVRSVDGEAVLGPIRGERLPAYHRLDLRVGRVWTLPRGRLNAYLDLQNVYDHDNVRGFEDFRMGSDAAGDPIVEADVVSWGGILPSVGLRWSF